MQIDHTRPGGREAPIIINSAASPKSLGTCARETQIRRLRARLRHGSLSH